MTDLRVLHFPVRHFGALVSASEDPWLHAAVVRQRARLSAVLADDGDRHIRHHHVLCREERSRNQVHQHPRGVLVHHRHHDHARVSR